MSYVRTIIQSIEPKTAEKPDLYLPQTFMRKHRIPSSTITVQFGSHSLKAAVKGAAIGKMVQMRSPLLKMLHLPAGLPLLMRYEESQHRLVFGPYIGILVSSYHKNNRQAPFGSFTSFYNELTDISRKKGGVVCVLSHEDVDWETQTVRGLLRRNGSWQAYTLPLPQCIYNRLSSRQTERSDSVNDWMEQCKEHQIPFFNEHFLNKWHVHKALLAEPEATRFLPKTIRYGSKQDVASMLAEFRTIYLKPTNGSMGKGVYRVKKTPEGYRLSAGTTRTYKTLPALQNALESRLKGRGYLLQQGLPLIGLGKRTADFRVLVQKNSSGQWAVTSLVARIGQNSVVSNVARGGTMMSATQALNVCGPWQGSNRPQAATLKRAALKIASLLEKQMDGHYAEFGIDLGVDVHGRVWLLEVNSKPSKATNTLQLPEGQELPRVPRPSVRRLLDYAQYVSGFPYVKGSTSTKSAKARKKIANRR